MRVIAGTCRSMPLATLPGNATRPTLDRVKETLFNVLMPHTEGSRFLDLFAGSGAIGIEALSRGAAHGTFVDNSRQAVRVIEKNLAFTRLAERADILCADASAALRKLSGRAKYDLIFMDPPYGNALERDILFLLPTLDLMAEDALVVVEASPETDFSYLEEAGFQLTKEKRYKNSRHLFLKCL